MMRLEVITTKGREKLVRIPNSTALAQLRDPVGVLEGGQTRVFFFLTQILWLQGNRGAGNPSMVPMNCPIFVTRLQQPLS